MSFRDAHAFAAQLQKIAYAGIGMSDNAKCGG